MKVKSFQQPKPDKKYENIRLIKECADMLTLEETEQLIKYIKSRFKFEIH